MKTKLLLAHCYILLHLSFSFSGYAQSFLGTSFSYSGRLVDGASVANGLYDLRFALFDAANGPSQIGPTLTNSSVSINDGLFTVILDFGANFPGADRFLELAVRTNGGGAFTILTPRQKITSAPYAITAITLSGSLQAPQLIGTVSSGQLSGTYSGAVTFNNPANSYCGNGGCLSNVNAATLGGLSGTNFWKITGNAGTIAGTHFLGTTDNQPLEFKVNGTRMLRLQANGVIGGSSQNQIDATSGGGTIAGGFANLISNSFGAAIAGGVNNTNIGDVNGGNSTIGGGRGNFIQASYATIAGGNLNSATALDATIGGGLYNVVSALSGTIAGGYSNTVTGISGTVPGGEENTAAGSLAMASGRRAKANHNGAFVWADSTGPDFASTANNQFLIRAGGGMGVNTNNPQSALHVNGTVTANAMSVGSSTVGGMFTLVSSTINPGGNSTLSPTTSYVKLNPTPFGVFLNSTTAIANGAAVGNMLILQGIHNSNTVTITNTANTKLGASTRVLGNGDTLTLIWDGSDWVELSFSNN